MYAEDDQLESLITELPRGSVITIRTLPPDIAKTRPGNRMLGRRSRWFEPPACGTRDGIQRRPAEPSRRPFLRMGSSWSRRAQLPRCCPRAGRLPLRPDMHDPVRSPGKAERGVLCKPDQCGEHPMGPAAQDPARPQPEGSFTADPWSAMPTRAERSTASPSIRG